LFKAAVLTISDSASKGARADATGPFIKDFLKGLNIFEVTKIAICPDEVYEIKKILKEWADDENIDLVVTTGGTGLSPRDVTPEATLSVIERQVPGMAEAIRSYGLKKTPRAMLSRGVVGIRKNTLIINLPGSKRAVKDGLEAIKEVLEHAIKKLKGDSTPCGES